MGLHKISNQGQHGAVSLHLYTPPFSVCKVWPEGSLADEWQDGHVGFYSVYGQRTPHLEGSRTPFSNVMKELLHR